MWETQPAVQVKPASDNDNYVAPDILIAPITRTEFERRIMSTKPKTAARIDQTRLSNLMHPQLVNLLFKFFSWLLLAEIQPSMWNINKTTLLLKESKDPLRPENYRLLKIGS